MVTFQHSSDLFEKKTLLHQATVVFATSHKSSVQYWVQVADERSKPPFWYLKNSSVLFRNCLVLLEHGFNMGLTWVQHGFNCTFNVTVHHFYPYFSLHLHQAAENRSQGTTLLPLHQLAVSHLVKYESYDWNIPKHAKWTTCTYMSYIIIHIYSYTNPTALNHYALFLSSNQKSQAPSHQLMMWLQGSF